MFKSEDYYPHVDPRDHKSFYINRTWQPARQISKELSLLPDKERDVLLEIGCAAGQSLGIYIDQCPFKKYIVIDVSKKMAVYTKEFYEKRGIRISSLCINLEDGVLRIKGNSVSVVVSSGTLYFLKNLENTFKQVKKVLKPKGIFAFDIMTNNRLIQGPGFVYPNINQVFCYSVARDTIETLAQKYLFKIKKKLIIEEETVVRSETEIGDHVLYILQKSKVVFWLRLQT